MSKQDKPARPTGIRPPDDGWTRLSEGALALESELRRFEELCLAARRTPLDSRKGIERAAKTTTEAASGQERVQAALMKLVSAINEARERHEANAAALQARGEEIKQRADELGALYERYSALGDEGRQINLLVQEVAESGRDASTPEKARAIVAAIEDIERRMTQLVDGAASLRKAAIEASIHDVAEQADSLRQQVAAARNKLGLLRKGLEANLPAQPLPN